MKFLALVRVEWVKTMSMRSTYLAFAAVAALSMMIEIGFYLKADESALVQGLKSLDLDPAWALNGYTSTQATMMVGFFMLMLPMTIVTFARQVAGENLSGTIRMILARPISRVSLIHAKFVVCMFYSLLLMGFFFALSYGMGSILFGWTGSIAYGNQSDVSFSQISPEFEELNRPENRQGSRGRGQRRWERSFIANFNWRATPMGQIARNQIKNEMESRLLTPRQCMYRLFIAWLFTSWTMLSLGAIAFFWSTLNKHPITAMALTLATLFMFSILQALARSEQNIVPLFTVIEPYLFTKGMARWTECFSHELDWPEIWDGVRLLGAYTLVFYGLAQFIFWRKDITS